MMGFLLVPMVLAAEPTQQFNKLFLNPMYRSSLNQDENYTYTVEVNPPDRVNEILSAIVTFQVWHNPTVRYYLWVDGKECNTKEFLVHTTYANAGEGTIYFDCSNVIQEAKEYTITLQADDDVGTVTAWLDLVYMNKPKAEYEVHGTNYRQGENGTVFLQLFDEYRNTINNASCEITVYYPDKTKWFDQIDIEFLENGLYYFDFVVPSITGIYMTSVFCYYNDAGYSSELPYTNVIYDGTIKDGTSPSPVTVQHSDCTMFHTDGTTYHEFRYNDAYIANVNTSLLTSIDLNWIGQTEKDESFLQLYDFTTSTWVSVGKNFTASKDKNRDCKNSKGVSRKQTTNLPNFINGTEIRFRIYNTLDAKVIITDDASIDFHTNGSYIADIRGSEEIHVNDWFFNYTGLIAEAVWNYVPRTLTENATLTNASLNDIWNYYSRNLTYYQEFNNLTPQEVWNYSNRQLTEFNFDIIDELQLANYIWNFTNRSLTYYQLNNISTYDIWSYNNRTLSSLDLICPIDYQQTANYIWNNTNRTLSSFDFITPINETSIANTIWNYDNRNLTYYEVNNITVIDIWNYNNRTLTFYAEQDNLTAEEVWSYVNRTLTEIVTINESLISENVWNYSARYTHGIVLT